MAVMTVTVPVGYQKQICDIYKNWSMLVIVYIVDVVTSTAVTDYYC